ncbi:MAG: hypothetical protein QM778_12275 [Myxococcales bacterium]
MHGKYITPTLALALTANLACGCPPDLQDRGALDENDGDMQPDAGGTCQSLTIGNGKLDLLFVIDNSGSMAQEQLKLAEQIPGLLRSLTMGQAADGSTFMPMRDIHVGVVTSDMGLSGSQLQLPPSCLGFGDDGVLRKGGASCSSAAPSGYLSYTPEQNNFEQTLTDLSCLAAVGTSGCGFEQQLEAMYKALAPASVKTFGQGTAGHGDLENQGFLRADAALAIVQLSDEEDCSVTPQGEVLFDDPTSHPAVRFPGTSQNLGLNIRCAYGDPDERESQVEKAGLIHPITRYVQEFKRDVKPNNPDSVAFIAIVGIPDGTEGMAPADILNHPSMGFAVDPQTGGGDPTNRNTAARDVCRQCVGLSAEDCMKQPVISQDQNGSFVSNPQLITGAKPGVRFVKVAQAFGEHGSVRSICAESYAPAVDHLVQKIAQLPSATPGNTGCAP